MLPLAKQSTLAFAKWPSISPIYAMLVTLTLLAPTVIHMNMTESDVYEIFFRKNLTLAINALFLFLNFICFLGVSAMLGSVKN